jgi:hypothetical protein
MKYACMQSATRFRWDELVRREVKAMDDASLGEIKQIGPGWVMTEKVNEKEMARFYLPKSLAKGFDGKVVRFNVTEEQAEKDFMKPVEPKPDEYEIYTTKDTPPGLDISVPSVTG